MKEFFISLDNESELMTLDTYEDAIIKIVRDMNASRVLGRLQVWIISTHHNIFGFKKELIENILRLLDITSINDLDVHVVSNDDYLVVSKDSRYFARHIIEEYKANDHIDVIIDVTISDKIIKSNDIIEVIKLLNETGHKYLHIWLNITAELIAYLPIIIARLDTYKLLDITSVTFDVSIYGSLTMETRDKLRAIPTYIINRLMDRHMNETKLLQHSTQICYNHDGNIIRKCPHYKKCVLSLRKRSKIRTASLLISIVKDLHRELEDKKKIRSN